MTYREWLAENHPDDVDDGYQGGCYGCPHEHFIDATRPEYCRHSNLTGNERCGRCWNREIPGTENNEKEENMAKATKCDRCGKYYDENREHQKNINGHKGYYDGFVTTTTSGFYPDTLELCDECITELKLFINGAKVVKK